MPFLHVHSYTALPAPEPETLATLWAQRAGLRREDVCVTWRQHPDTAIGGGCDYALLAEVHAPDLYRPERVARLLESAAALLAEHTGLPPRRLFVSFRPAHSGEVLDGGRLLHWDPETDDA